MQKNKTVIYAIIAALVVGGICFYAGTKFAGAKTGASQGQFQARAGQFGQNRGGASAGARNGGGFVMGTILSVSDTGITVKLPTGGSTIIVTSPSTAVLKAVSGTMSDLTVGQNVSVQGTTNSDGSVTAQSIQLRPAMQQR